MYIYKTTNLITNKIYIGLCTKKSDSSITYLGSGLALKRSIKKHGVDNFKKEIIVESVFFSYPDLQFLEKYFIKEYDSTNPKIGYNISQGGDGNYGEVNGMFGRNHSKETIELISKTRLEKIAEDPNYGKRSEKATEKFINFISERNKTHPTLPNGHTEETKKRIGETVKRKIDSGELVRNYATFSDERKKEWSERFSGEGNPFYGKTHSDEAKQKIKESYRKRFPPVNKIDDEGNVVKRYESVPDVIEDGYRPDLVKLVDKGKNNKHKGFKWKILWDEHNI